MSKLLPHMFECSIIQLYNLQVQENGGSRSHCFINGIGMVTEEKIPEQVQELLNQYEDLFREPTQLPPPRNHDHKIPLKKGIDAVNMRPYRHLALQKDVEKLV